MKITSRKDHPVILVLFLLFCAIIADFRDADPAWKDNAVMVLFIGFLAVAYYSQIKQSISVEEGVLKIRKRKEEYEFQISNIMMFARIGRTLQIATENARLSLDASAFTKKQIKLVDEELKKQKAQSE